MNDFDEKENENILNSSGDDEAQGAVDHTFSEPSETEQTEKNSVWSSSESEDDVAASHEQNTEWSSFEGEYGNVFVQENHSEWSSSASENTSESEQEHHTFENHGNEQVFAENTPFDETGYSSEPISEEEFGMDPFLLIKDKKAKNEKKAARKEKKKNAPPKQRLRDDLRDLWQIICNWGKRTAIAFARRLKQTVHYLLLFLPAVLFVASIVFSITCQMRIQDVRERQYTQQAAQRWTGNTGVNFVQFSCFTRWKNPGSDTVAKPLGDVAYSISRREMEAIRASLRKIIAEEESDVLDKYEEAERERIEAEREKLEAEQAKISQLAAINETEPVEEDETETAVETAPAVEIPIISENQSLINERRIMFDAYSTESRAFVQADTEGTAAANVETMVTAVAGDYFLIHNMPLHSGSYLMENSQDSKRVVLDEGLAFTLFRSFDVAGSIVLINGEKFTVNGVVAKSEHKEETTSYGIYPRAYILFSEIAVLDLRVSSTPDDEAERAGLPVNNQPKDISEYAVMCYEAVIPESLDGLSEQYLVRAFAEAEGSSKNLEAQDGSPGNFYLVENTTRYDFKNLWDGVFPLGKDRMILSEFTLPFWEITAKQAGDMIFFWWVMFFISLFAMFISVCGVYSGFFRNPKRKDKIRRIKIKKKKKSRQEKNKKKDLQVRTEDMLFETEDMQLKTEDTLFETEDTQHEAEDTPFETENTQFEAENIPISLEDIQFRRV